MALGDPFSSTEEGARQGMSDFGSGISSGINAITQQKLQSKQRQQGIDTLKQLGLVKINKTDPTNDDLESGLKAIGQKMGANVVVNQGSDETQTRNNLLGIYKALNIPLPKGKTTVEVNPGVTMDLGGGMSYTAPKPEKSIVQQVADVNAAQQMLKSTPGMSSDTVSSTGGKLSIKPDSGGFGSAYAKIARETAPAIADGVKQGDMAGYMTSSPIAKELAYKQLHDEGINVEDGIKDYTATMQLTKTMNQNQQVNLMTSFNTVGQDIPVMRDLNDKLQRTNIDLANKFIIESKSQGISLDPSATKDMNDDQIKLVSKYLTQMNLMRDSMAVAYMRGGVPSDKAFDLSDKILNPIYGGTRTDAALDQIGVNLNIRKSAIPASGYVPGQQQSQGSPQATLQAAGMGGQTQQKQLTYNDYLKSISQ